MHVLWLPSWYPESPNEIRGSFFREQALALHCSGIQVGILAASLKSLRSPYKAFMSPGKVRSENDEGVVTLRMSLPNLAPRAWLLNQYAYSWMFTRLFEAYITQEGMPDLLHLHATLPGGAGAISIHTKYDIPVVLTEHSSIFFRNMVSNRQLKTAAQVAKLAQSRSAVSSVLAQHMQTRLSSPNDSWNTVHNPVSGYFLDSPTITSQKGKFKFLHISNLNANKNVSLILQAFSKKFRGQSGVELVVGGDGPLLNRLQKEAHDLGISSQVEFAGSLTRAQVRERFLECDAFVLSSNHETFSVVLVEAMAMGCPVISTKCGGPQEIVSKETGILVEPNNIQEMAEAMKLLFQSQNKFEPRKIRDLCLDRFGPTKATARWQNIYSEILSKEQDH